MGGGPSLEESLLSCQQAAKLALVTTQALTARRLSINRLSRLGRVGGRELKEAALMQAPICVIEAASKTSAFKQASLATTGKMLGKKDSVDLYKNSASSI